MTDARHIEAQIYERLSKVIDPELGRSITDLGMIAAINAVGVTSQDDGDVPSYDVTVHVELTVEAVRCRRPSPIRSTAQSSHIPTRSSPRTSRSHP